jgi:hypothetical protein
MGEEIRFDLYIYIFIYLYIFNKMKSLFQKDYCLKKKMEFDKRAQIYEEPTLSQKTDPLSTYKSHAGEKLETNASNADGGKKHVLTSSITHYPELTNFNTPNRTGWPINYRGSTAAISQNIPTSVQRAPSVGQNNLRNLRGSVHARAGTSTLEHLPGGQDIHSLLTHYNHNFNSSLHDLYNSGMYHDQLNGGSRIALKGHKMINNPYRSKHVQWVGNTVAGSHGTDQISVNPSMNKDQNLFLDPIGTQNIPTEAAAGGFVSGRSSFQPVISSALAGKQRAIGTYGNKNEIALGRVPPDEQGPQPRPPNFDYLETIPKPGGQAPVGRMEKLIEKYIQQKYGGALQIGRGKRRGGPRKPIGRTNRKAGTRSIARGKGRARRRNAAN